MKGPSMKYGVIIGEDVHAPWVIDQRLSEKYDKKAASIDELSRLSETDRRFKNGWFERQDGLIICLSVVRDTSNGAPWLHVSCALQNKLPNYADMQWIYRNICEPGLPAIEEHVPTDEHVHIAENCRHLWQRLDARAVPDFRVNGHVWQLSQVSE